MQVVVKRRQWLLKILSLAVLAPTGSGLALSLQELQWSRRIIVAYGEDGDAAVEQFLELVRDSSCELKDRDLDVYLVTSQGVAQVTTDAAELDVESETSLKYLRQATSTEFEMVLVGKDGGVKGHSEFPNELTQFFTLIDGMPMRQRELEERGELC